jgi:mono/diheme cytochrome c family protein
VTLSDRLFPPSLALRHAACVFVFLCFVGGSTSFFQLSTGSTKTLDDQALEILGKHCFRCHGPETQEAGLRLDSAQAIQTGGDSGPAIVAGQSKSSRLIDMIQGNGDSTMPPDGEKLSPIEIAVLIDWVNRGANWSTTFQATDQSVRSTHWSFQPIRSHIAPPVNDRSWAKSELDHFVLARIEQESLQPAPEADRRTLIRRLSLDLRGLPPDESEIDGYLRNDDPSAYEHLVDRFLASPEFGERWARHWLDRTQYGETSGCVIDLPRPFPWRWRDWVVASLNDDLPFDQFTLYQLAGDLIPNPTPETRMATGFFCNALTNHEAGIDLEAEFVKTTVDRTSIVGATWLELTLGCAECHSHKFDPISQRDFYRMYAFFNTLDDCVLDCITNSDRPETELTQTLFEQEQQRYGNSHANQQSEWESQIRSTPDVWTIPKDYETVTFRTLSHAMVHLESDGSFSVDGRVRNNDDHVVSFRSPLKSVTAIRVELLPDRDRFHLGPGRCKNGHCRLTGFSVSASPIGNAKENRDGLISDVFVDYCQPGFSPHDVSVDPNAYRETGWSVDHKGMSHVAVFKLKEPLEVADSIVTVKMHFLSDQGRTPARFRIAVTDAPQELWQQSIVPGDIREIINKKHADRSNHERAFVKRYIQTIHDPASVDLARWNRALEDRAEWLNPRGAESIQQSWQSKETYVHLRGEFRRRGDRVQPGIPAVFLSRNEEGKSWTRLELAEWLTSEENPLTARVAANSIWQVLFGEGLVRSPGDFGRQGEVPMHPDLLDWLATEFRQSGWSRKALIRRVVGSATYRQSCVAPASQERDPQNRFLARQSRFRLDAETVRDCVLDRSGLLLRRMGGPSFFMNGSSGEETKDWHLPALRPTANDQFRRGLYISVPRTTPDPMMNTFDAPDGASVCPMRQRTNTPLQAMTLMNDPLFVAASNRLAHSISSASVSDREKGIRLWKHCLGREPTAQEVVVLEQLLHDLVEESKGVGASEEPLDVWFVMARTVLNLDEMVTRE